MNDFSAWKARRGGAIIAASSRKLNRGCPCEHTGR